MKSLHHALGVSCSAFALACLVGCDKGAAPASKPAEAAHDHDHDHDHAHASESGHAHGAVVEMGEQKAGPYTVKLSRDGDIKPGGEVPVDIWVDGGAKGKAVRVWFGTEDAKGSIKAKCEVEDGQWHAHGEVPDPMPAGAKLWVEVEGEDGTKTVVGFTI